MYFPGLNSCTFRVSHFPVSHLTYVTVKLDLQNTLNMSKTTRVYFGVLQWSLALSTPNKVQTCKSVGVWKVMCNVGVGKVMCQCEWVWKVMCRCVGV